MADTGMGLAERTGAHMTRCFPGALPVGGWTVARDTRDGTAVVVWRSGGEPVQPLVRGMVLYRWLCSLRDAGFAAEASTDMDVFGRPEQESPDRVARYLRVTAWSSAAAAAAEAPLPPLPPAPPHAYVPLAPQQGHEFRCPLSGIVPAEVHVRYLPGGALDLTLTYESGDRSWGQGVPAPPPWLLELVEKHRPVGGAELAAPDRAAAAVEGGGVR
jgi:hypothetical protein